MRSFEHWIIVVLNIKYKVLNIECKVLNIEYKVLNIATNRQA